MHPTPDHIEWDSFWDDVYSATYFLPVDPYSAWLFEQLDGIREKTDRPPFEALTELIEIEIDSSLVINDRLRESIVTHWLDKCLAAEPYLTVLTEQIYQLVPFLDDPAMKSRFDEEIQPMDTSEPGRGMTPRELCAVIDQMTDFILITALLRFGKTLTTIEELDFTGDDDFEDEMAYCAYVAYQPELLDPALRLYRPIAVLGLILRNFTETVLNS